MSVVQQHRQRKCFSAEEIFIAEVVSSSDSDYSAAVPNYRVPVAGATNPEEEEKRRCD